MLFPIATYFLSQYPDVVKRLRQEILSKVGPTRRPDYDDIRDMKYLRAFINGKLRPCISCEFYLTCVP